MEKLVVREATTFLTVRAVAAEREVKIDTVQKWLQSGRLLYQQIGRTRIINERDLCDFQPRRVGNPGKSIPS